MSVPLQVTPLTRDDIRRAERYFETRRTGLGTEFVDEVLATLEKVGEMPLGYGEVGKGVRAVGLRRFGYVAYYRFDGTIAEVVAILHGGRQQGAWESRI